MSIQIISDQCMEIATKADYLQRLLKSPQVQKFYLENPDKQQALLDTVTLNTKKLVLWGMKWHYSSDVLPSNQELYTPANDARSEGDVLLCWATFYAGAPRVIDSYNPDSGYTWHFLGESENIREPNRYDPYFSFYGLHPMIFDTAVTEAEQITEIEAFQTAEITGLNTYIQLFETQDYRDM